MIFWLIVGGLALYALSGNRKTPIPAVSTPAQKPAVSSVGSVPASNKISIPIQASFAGNEGSVPQPTAHGIALVQPQSPFLVPSPLNPSSKGDMLTATLDPLGAVGGGDLQGIARFDWPDLGQPGIWEPYEAMAT